MQIGAVLKAWLDRLVDGSIEYQLDVRAMPGPALAEWTLVGPVMPRDADPADYVKYVDL